MKSLAIALAVGSTVVVSGCASNRVAVDQGYVAQYCTQMKSDHRIDPVRSQIQIPLVVGQPQPPEMLSNQSYAAAEERPAIRALAQAYDSCTQFERERLEYSPGYRTASQDRVRNALVQLEAGNITYGDFAHKMLSTGERKAVERESHYREQLSQLRWQEIDGSN